MNLHQYCSVPTHIVLRRYDDVEIYDLKRDESYVVDEEAYSLLTLLGEQTTIKSVIDQYEKDKKEEVSKAIEQFNQLKIVKYSDKSINDPSSISNTRTSLPQKNPFNPPYLKNIMINITEHCNLTCKHCYITAKNQKDMELGRLMKLIHEFYKVQGIRLILTGGEPFLFDKLKELLQKLKEIPLQKVILTNGVLISKQEQEMLDLLKENHFEIFVSLDGLEEAHNEFRDANCFKEVIKGIRRLIKNKISVSINTMVHKKNFNEFEELSQLLKYLKKIKNWAIDIPTFDESTPQNIRDIYEISQEKGGYILRKYGWGVMSESSPSAGSIDYACGPNLMAVDVVGTVTKCGFFSGLSPGNVFDIGLKESWEFIQQKANWDINELACSELGCEFLKECRGGCRFRSSKYSNDIRGIDPYKCYQYGKKVNISKVS